MEKINGKIKNSDGDEVNKLIMGIEELINANSLVLLDTSALTFDITSCFNIDEMRAAKNKDKDFLKKMNIPQEVLKQSVEYNGFLAMLLRIGYRLRVLDCAIREYPTARNGHIDQFGFHYIKHGLARRYLASTEAVEETLRESIYRIDPNKKRKIYDDIGKLLVGDKTLSAADIDCLVASLISARHEGNTALLTNDKGISNKAIEIRRKMDEKPKSIIVPRFRWGVYTMLNSDSFKEVTNYEPDE